MRNLIGSVVLVCLAVVLWRLAPRALATVRPARADVTPSALRAPEPDHEQATSAQGPALRVLFVGNSHTFFHDMPRTIQQLAAAAGEARRFEPVLETAGGATLREHLAGLRVRERLGNEHWDYVVLQEQQQRPTWRQPYLEQEFFVPVRTLDVLIRAASARTVLYMTPARLDGDKPEVADDTYERMQERSRLSHVRLGEELSAIVAPVGVAWATAHREYPALPLWAADRYHPAAHGAYLTACVFYDVLYGRKSYGNTYASGLPPADAGALQRAADTALTSAQAL